MRGKLYKNIIAYETQDSFLCFILYDSISSFVEYYKNYITMCKSKRQVTHAIT